MESTLRLYHTLVGVLSQHRNWLDLRHLQTLAWMIVGLIHSGMISLTAWAPYVCGRATYAQSTVRRFARWLNNPRIEVHQLYGPLIQQALAEWGPNRLYLALDTSTVSGFFCLVRIAVIYRGRAVPLVWRVLERESTSVAYGTYKDLLNQAARLLPLHCVVVLLADRGFADTHLMRHLDQLGWHWRIRIKGSFWVYHRGRRCKVKAIPLARGRARFWHEVLITEQWYGPVHLALARPGGGREDWYVVSDEPTGLETFNEYGLRFDIEENFLDDKSNGFQLESSLIRSAEALTRLCFVLAMTTLYLVCQGTEVVKEGKRRWVDPHWFRGSSYLKLVWNWIKAALVKGWELISRLRLLGEPDPEPAKASKIQGRRRAQPDLSVMIVRDGRCLT
jgi:hypothetical protein